MGNRLISNFLSFKSGKENKCTKRPNECDLNEASIKRFRSTFDYLYQKLYIEGESSDVEIHAMNKQWNLHKLYISQSPFFASMFSGSWLEKSMNKIDLEFTDSNITTNALDVVFGSFYYDSIELQESNVVSVLATAIWFQLDDLRKLCEAFIENILSLENVVGFYDIGILYELPNLTEKCINWLSSTILLIDDCEAFYSILKMIPFTLILEIIRNPRLFVVQVEQDVFLLALKWLYLHVFPTEPTFTSDFTQLVQNYFRSDKCLKEVEQANSDFYKLFDVVRWDNMISSFNTASSLTKFTVIPKHILMNAFKNQWLNLLRCQDVKCFGPPDNLDSVIFWNYSERCGRKLVNNNNLAWRWSAYKYGVDVVIRYSNREFYVVRYIDRLNCPDWIRHIPVKRRIQLHFTVCSYQMVKCGENAFYPLYKSSLSSGVLSLELSENLPTKVLTIPSDFEFPMVLSANILRYDPTMEEQTGNYITIDDSFYI